MIGSTSPGDWIYLDWNAATPLCSEVLAEMAQAQARCWANPSSVHGLGRAAWAAMEEARSRIAALVDAHTRDVIFTSGGTEANNLALQGAKTILTSRLEHPSIVKVAEALAKQGTGVAWLPVPPSGCLDPGDVGKMLGRLPSRVTVAVQAVNHETGVVQPLAEIRATCDEFGAHLHVDAIQAIGKLPREAWNLGHSVSLTAHKLRGPKGIGALIWGCGSGHPHALLHGGAQERGIRPGTQDAVMAMGLALVAQRANLRVKSHSSLVLLRNQLEASLWRDALVNGAEATRVAHVSSLFFPGWLGPELVAALDLEGICLSSGSACSAKTAEASPVISAMLGQSRAEGTVRISLGETTTATEIEKTVGAFERVLCRMKPG